jgi:hypothetical protein
MLDDVEMEPIKTNEELVARIKKFQADTAYFAETVNLFKDIFPNHKEVNNDPVAD